MSDQQQAAGVEQEAAGRGGLSQEELDELVASSDTGGRSASGVTNQVVLGVALIWSLFQLWIASPIPFILGFGVFNDTEARSIHLALAVFLAFLAYPAARTPLQLGLGLGVPLLLGFLFWFGGEGLLPIATATLVGVPAYLNGYAALPVVAGLIDQGMAPGAGLAFLVGGGVTSLPAAIAVFALVKLRVFLLYLALALAGSFAAGLLFQAAVVGAA